MRVVNQLFDERINALNALLVMTIREYVAVGKEITALRCCVWVT
jgi:hypothetical protein